MFSTTNSASDTCLSRSVNPVKVCSGLPERPQCTSDLSVPLYNVPSKSSNEFECKGQSIVVKCSGDKSFDLKKELEAHVATYTAPTVSAAGYGGSVTTTVSAAGYGGLVTTAVVPTKLCQSKDDRGGDLGKEKSSKERENEFEGNSKESDRPKAQTLTSAIVGKCNDAKNLVMGLLTPPVPPTVVSAAGYGGAITPAPMVVATPSGGTLNLAGSNGVKTVHFNQGIGNGAEGGDPGKSQPRGGSNDESGRTPGKKSC